MLGLISSALGGGILGVLGSIFSNVLNYFTQKQKNKHDLELKKFELARMDKEKEYMLAEAQANIKITEAEVEGAIGLEEARAFTESQKQAMQSLLKPSLVEKLLEYEGKMKPLALLVAGFIAFIFGLVDFIKHLIRPGITIFVSLVFGYVVYKSWTVLEASGHQWSPKDALAIITICVETVVALIMMIYGWWFADRRMAKFAQRLSDGNIKGR